MKSKWPRPPSQDEDEPPVQRPWNAVLRGLEEGDDVEEADEEGRNVDMDEDEDEPPRPASRRKKKRRGKRTGVFGGMSPLFIGVYVLTVGGVLGVCVVLVLASFFLPDLGEYVDRALFFAGIITMFIGYVWFIRVVWQGSVLIGLACVWFPISFLVFAPIFLLTHFGAVKKPLLVWLIGVGMIGAGLYLGVRGEAMSAKPPAAPTVQSPAPPPAHVWPEPNSRNFYGVQVGMTEVEVVAHFGPPAAVSTEAGVKRLQWKLFDGIQPQTLDVQVTNGKVIGAGCYPTSPDRPTAPRR